MADRITAKTAKKLKEEKNLCLIGTGGGMMYNIRMMAMSFVYKQEIDVETGRDLLVSAVNEYVNAVNSNEEIRPYLANYPFEAKNIEIRIFVHNQDDSLLAPGKLCYLTMLRGELRYDIESSDQSLLQTIHRETYEEALKKVAEKAA